MKHILSLLLFLATLGVYAQVPGTLSYQGLLVNASGEPVTDGNHFVKFRFYTAPSDGTLIHETGTLQVVTYKGMFTTVIGAGGVDNPVLTLDASSPNYIANKSIYVEITADGVQLTPRVPLTTVTNAQHANNANNANVVPASGVTGVLSVAQGGTGETTLTGVFIGHGTEPATGLAASGANQYLKSNIDNSGYEFAELPVAIASNGLTINGTETTLGGTLSGNTSIATDGHNLTIEGTGNMGIGTNNPAYPLSIYTSTDTTGLHIKQEYAGDDNQHGLIVDLSAATGTGVKYGINNTVSGTDGSGSNTYGILNTITGSGANKYGVFNDVRGTNGNIYGSYSSINHEGGGDSYGFYTNINKASGASGPAIGLFSYINNNGTNASYLMYGNVTGGGSNKYGTYISGEDINYFSGKLGLGTATPFSKLDVEGGVAIGASYSGTTAAPPNGLLVEGNVGIGLTSPTSKLHIDKSGTGNYIHFSEGGTTRGFVGISSGGNELVTGASDNQMVIRSHTGSLLFSTVDTEKMRIELNGNVGIGVTTPANKLDVAGSVTIGTSYSGTYVAPSSGLLVQGNVSIGDPTPTGSKLDVFPSSTLGMTVTHGYTGASDHKGIVVNLPGGTTTTGIKYGIDNTVEAANTSASSIYGDKTTVEHAGSGNAYGFYVEVDKPGIATGGDTYGVYVDNANHDTGNSYILYGTSGGLTTGTEYGVYVTGEDLNYFNGKVSLGEPDLADVGTYKLYVSGNAYATGVWTPSDVRYKKNFNRLTSVLSKVQLLEGFSYEWRRNENPEMNLPVGKHYGFKAQEVEKYFPELVSTSDTGYKTLNYAGMTPVLLEAVKEQQTQIEQLQAEVAELRKQATHYSSLSAEIDELKKLIKQSQPTATSTSAGNDKK